jgi:hypothetical protein
MLSSLPSCCIAYSYGLESFLLLQPNAKFEVAQGINGGQWAAANWLRAEDVLVPNRQRREASVGYEDLPLERSHPPAQNERIRLDRHSDK